MSKRGASEPGVQTRLEDLQQRILQGRREQGAHGPTPEQALLELFHGGDEARVLLLPDGEVLDASSGARNLFNWPDPGQVEGRFDEQTVLPEEGLGSWLSEVLGETAQSIEVTHRCRPGELRDLLLRGQKVQLYGRQVVWLQVTDITPRTQARRIQALLLDIARAASATEELHDLISRIRSELGQFIATQNFYVALYDEARGSYTFPFYVDEKDPDWAQSPLSGSMTDYVRRSGRPFLYSEQGFQELEARGEVKLVGSLAKAWLGVPLRVRGRVIGVVGMQDYERADAYDEEDMDLLGMVSDSVAVSIERRRIEQALRESEERFRSFVQRSPDGIWCVDLEPPVSTQLTVAEQVRQIVSTARFVECNQTFVEMYGFDSREHVLGKGLHELPAETDRERSNASLGRFVREGYRMATGESWESIRDGSQKVFDNQLIGILEDEGLVRIWGAQRDMTRSKLADLEAQRRRTHLEDFINNAADGIVFVDREDLVRSANPAFCEMFRFSENELVGKPNELIVPEHLARESRHLFERSGEEQIIRLESVRQRKDGSLLDVDISGTPIRIDDELVGTYWVYQDIGSRVRAQRIQQVISRVAAATATASDLDELLLIVHHELGTLIDTSNFYIALYDGASDSYRFRYFVDDLDEVDSTRHYAMKQTLTDHVRQHGSFRFGSPDKSDQPDWASDHEHSGPDSRSWLGTQLRVPGDVLGVVVAQSYTKYEAYDENDQELLEYVSDHLAVAIQHKRNQDAIRESEERYRTLFDQSPVGVMLFDPELNISAVNERLCEILGVEQEQLKAINLADLNDERVAQAARRSLAGSNEFFQGLYQSTLSGSELWLRGNVASIRGPEGEVRGGLILVEDITEQHETSRELELQKAHTELLFQNAPEGIVLLDAELNVMRVNRDFERMFGYSSEDVVGGHLSPLLVPESLKDELARINEWITKGERFGIETRRLRKGGGEVDVSMLGAAIIVEDEQVAYYLIYRDISERKRDERLLTALYNIARQAATTQDVDELIETVREQTGRLIDTTNFSVALYDEESKSYRFAFHVDEYDSFDKRESYRLEKSLTDLVRRNGKALLINEEDYEDLIASGEVEPKAERARGWMGVPLRHEEKVVGVLGVVNYRQPHFWTERDLELLEFMAEQIMSMIDHLDAELALSDSEKRYRTLFDQSPTGVMLYDQELRIRDVNERLSGIARLPAEQLRGAPLDIFESEELVEAFRSSLGGELVQFDGPCRRPGDGTELWLEVRVNPHFGGGDEIIGGIAVVHDVSRQRETERRAELNRRYLEQLFEGAPEAIVLLDPRYRVIRLNAEFSKMFDFAIGELLGQNLLDNLLPEDDHGREQRRLFENVSQGKTERLEETVCLRKDGKEVDVSLLATPIVIDGEMIALYAIYRDITARKKAVEELASEKEHLAVTLGAIGDAVITVDEAGKVVLINRAGAELTGWNGDEAIGHTVGEVLPLASLTHIPDKTREADKQRFGEIVKARLRENREDLLVTRTGEEKVVLASAAPIRDSEASTVGTVIVVRDVTDQRKIEEEIAKIERLESVGVLAGGIAHDFNNILSAVLGNISIARLAGSDDTMREERIEEAERAALRARELTQQLLTFARGGEPVRKALNIYEVVEESATFALRGSKASYKLEAEEGLWPVQADEAQLGRVINNLIINADQAMPGGGKVEVELINQQVDSESGLPLEPGRYVRIQIRDEGIGIGDDHLARIFDPFFTTKQRGSGLGLATSFSIVQKHDGHLGVQSSVGVGTTFTIHLPAAQEQPDKLDGDGDVEFRGEGRVLIMDDEEPVREVVRVMLEEMGYETETASDGARAIEIYQQARAINEPFDAVIMDLTIPGGMGGEEAIRLLRKLDPNVCAIVASGYSNDPVMADHTGFGFRGVVAKPFGYEDLKRVMMGVLAGPGK